MSVHHLVKVEDIAEACPYCKLDLSQGPWQSRFVGENHYKTAMCSCGKEMWMHVPFYGSGHDSWNKRQVQAAPSGKTIDDKLTIAPKIRLAPKKW